MTLFLSCEKTHRINTGAKLGTYKSVHPITENKNRDFVNQYLPLDCEIESSQQDRGYQKKKRLLIGTCCRNIAHVLPQNDRLCGFSIMWEVQFTESLKMQHKNLLYVLTSRQPHPYSLFHREGKSKEIRKRRRESAVLDDSIGKDMNAGRLVHSL